MMALLNSLKKILKKVKESFVNQNDTFWFCFLLGIAAIGASITIFGGDNNGRDFSTPFFYATIILCFFWLVCKMIFVIKKRDFYRPALIVFAVAMLIGLFNIVIQTPINDYSFDYLKKIILIGVVFVYIYLIADGSFSKVILKVFGCIVLGISLEIVISFASGIGRHYHNETAKNMLLFTFSNANTAGIYFAILILANFFCLFRNKNIIFKIVHGLFAAFLIYLLYLTHARNAIIGLLLCIFLVLALMFNSNGNKKFDLVVMLICCTLPIVIASLYINLAVNTNFLDGLNNFIGSSGKSTTSRIEAWSTGFKHFNGIKFLIGDYHDSTLRAYELFNTLPSNQNSQIDLFTDLGLVPACLLIGFLTYVSFRNVSKIDKDRFRSYLPVVFWMFSIFSSIFESGLFLGMSVWYVFGFSFFAFGNIEGETVAQKDAGQKQAKKTKLKRKDNEEQESDSGFFSLDI